MHVLPPTDDQDQELGDLNQPDANHIDRAPTENDNATSIPLAPLVNTTQPALPPGRVFTAEGEVLHFDRVSRKDMGFYICIASNGVPPSVSQRIFLPVSFTFTHRQAHASRFSGSSNDDSATGRNLDAGSNGISSGNSTGIATTGSNGIINKRRHQNVSTRLSQRRQQQQQLFQQQLQQQHSSSSAPFERRCSLILIAILILLTAINNYDYYYYDYHYF